MSISVGFAVVGSDKISHGDEALLEEEVHDERRDAWRRQSGWRRWVSRWNILLKPITNTNLFSGVVFFVNPVS